LVRSRSTPRREAADNKAQAIDDLRASKMGKAADLVEQVVHETLTYYGFPDIHWQKIRTNNPLERIMKRSGAEPASSVLSPTVSPASTWRTRDYGTSPAQHGRPNAT
jgi:transposase-like protein